MHYLRKHKDLLVVHRGLRLSRNLDPIAMKRYKFFISWFLLQMYNLFPEFSKVPSSAYSGDPSGPPLIPKVGFASRELV